MHKPVLIDQAVPGAWATDGQDDDALEALIGQRRAQILRELNRPASGAGKDAR